MRNALERVTGIPLGHTQSWAVPGSGRPSRAVSLGVSLLLVALWAWVRLFVFDTVIFPLTYVLPLLVCVWTRDRVALWGMAGTFFALHTIKLYWLLPPGSLSRTEFDANYLATLLNLGVGALAVNGVLVLRDRLERALEELHGQAEELRAQSEELAQQNEELTLQGEELTQQAEELTQQGEELATQNEALQLHARQNAALNQALARREALLQTLLETARLSRSEDVALRHIVTAARDLFGELDPLVAVVEVRDGDPAVSPLVPLATAPASAVAPADDPFVRLVLSAGRTAALDDRGVRPDLQPAPPAGLSAGTSGAGALPFPSVLCVPIRRGSSGEGLAAPAVLVIYGSVVHTWSDEAFRLGEWLALQCRLVLDTLRVQADLREADRQKTEFLAMLSHELRNPLAAIRFALTLLDTGRGNREQQLAVLRRQVRQLVRLVDDLLDATRLTRNKIQVRKQRTDLVALLQQALDTVRPDLEGLEHTLDVQLPSSPVWIDADGERLSQVAINLLTNAARYTPPGGTVRLRLDTGDDEVGFRIADTGVGLADGDRHRIFEMFTQVGAPGSGGLGIGLALVRGIVDLHDGRVEALSDGPGRGSEFRVTLPRVVSLPTEAPAVTDAVGLVAGLAWRVLVVDDNRDSAEMLREFLVLHGHQVQVAHDGASAVDAARTFVPDVALLDIGLPDVDGYQVARQLRGDGATRGVRLVAVTGWGQEGDRTRAREAGFDAHLTKPVKPEAILAALGQAGGSSSARI